MTAQDIRQAFIRYFEEKDHLIVPSAPIVIKDDPTLMFTNAGMNQFKDVFLGVKAAAAPRVADVQKCLRVSGKHNDLEEVGHDTYHHTMFEMLGNWSFGDYFKKEAIDWAWELLTDVYKIDKERLYATVFEGDAALGVVADEEAYKAWQKHLPSERILYGNKKDNFWEMGETGPCGPSSEIHIDLRSDAERAKKDGAELVNGEHERVIELWNLVFIQFNRKADGSLETLQSHGIDTGMGFERLCMVLQHKASNYDTDVFMPVIEGIERMSGIDYGRDEQHDVAFRVIADHIRAIAFAIADGQLPSNTGAGYVIRRILRRAVRYGYSYLNFKEPFLYALIPVLEKIFEGVYPEIAAQREFIQKVIREEEQSFLRTLENGLRRLEQIKKEHAADRRIPGEVVFELYDTYGFPADLTRLIAREWGYETDEAGFEKAMARQKNRSRAAGSLETGDWIELQPGGEPEFTGYEQSENEARPLRYRKVKQKNKELYQLVLDKTPFYAESGGQTGDTGVLEFNATSIPVIDTKKENELIVHYLEQSPVGLPPIVKARVDVDRRRRIAANHSATHLLHAALRKVLGAHVTQKGSFVGPDYLRFDFSHFEKLSEEQIREVERLVNEKIWADIPRKEERALPFEEARRRGAMALFGEKYGDKVRMITFGEDFSVELCGGIHVESTGQIGLFKISHESAVAAGVRRIEALTADGAYEYVSSKLKELNEIAAELRHPKNVVKAVKQLSEENRTLKKKVEAAASKLARAEKAELLNKTEKIGNVNFLGAVLDIGDGAQLKNLSFQLKKELPRLFAILGTRNGDKALINIVVSEELVKEYELDAGRLIREIAPKTIAGGGGGQAFFASAGGKDAGGLEAAIDMARKMIIEKAGNGSGIKSKEKK